MKKNVEPFFVTACNAKFYLQTNVFIQSLLKNGNVKPEAVLLLAFGSSLDESSFVADSMRRCFPKINIEIIDLKNRHFNFLSFEIQHHMWAGITDYLRAWIGKKIKHYIWMDSDILIRKSLSDLQVPSSSSIRMAADHLPHHKSPPQDRRILLNQAYQTMYKHIFKKQAKVSYSPNGIPYNLNSGVMTLSKDFSEEWKEYFIKLQPLNKEKTFQNLLINSMSYFQGIWNIIHWNNSGEILDSKWNYLYAGFPNPPRNFHVYHYNLRKEEFWRDVYKYKIYRSPG